MNPYLLNEYVHYNKVLQLQLGSTPVAPLSVVSEKDNWKHNLIVEKNLISTINIIHK